jgi:hypothetical protein
MAKTVIQHVLALSGIELFLEVCDILAAMRDLRGPRR